ncbi:hypothetical protein [Acidihalobacter ferrooxydans]|uniref:Carboxypeptidase regulatory-like domain-containing protein n=1 Tax=Acidihalobacter ferrooxydans TaxID=1765967 RepID=A0A1P8UFZ1_9GAMM|nr:hypothetical protein [Acidihalobacter ferrooxydans]APZ42735.1 hypothetical protein BW247_06190 [Acidihalobacter ferrooxydans]
MHVRRHLRRAPAWLLTLSLAFVALPAAQAAQITHRCGGVGESKLKALLAQAPHYNLGFWMVEGHYGAYLADVPVRILHQGKTVAAFTAGGPLCWAKAPPGRYEIEARHDGVMRRVTVHTGQKPVYLWW